MFHKNPLRLVIVIFTVFGFAVAQPIYALLISNSQYLIVNRVGAPQLFFLVFVLSFAIPLLLCTTVFIFDFFRFRALSNATVFLIVWFLFVCWFNWLAAGVAYLGDTRLLFSVLTGLILTIVFFTRENVRRFIIFLSPTIFLFPLMFILSPSIFNDVVRPASFHGERVIVSEKNTLPPVIMIVFDEFLLSSLLTKDYAINAQAFPNFSLFLKNAHWFRNATTNHHETPQALPIILTGRYPSSDSVNPTYGNFPQNIFTLLSNTHGLKVIEYDTHLCPDDICPQRKSFDYLQTKGLPSRKNSFEKLLIESAIIYINAILPQKIIRMVKMFDIPSNSWSFDGRDSAYLYHLPHGSFFNLIGKDVIGKPDFYFLHASRLPHRPWRHMASGKFYRDYIEFNAEIPGIQNGVWTGNKSLISTGFERYLEQVIFTDRWLGVLIEKLKAADIYDKSLIIITADHGFSFIPDSPVRFLTQKNFHQILPIPLFIKKPFQEVGVISDKNVESVDIMATVADILRIRLPWPTDGYSAFSDHIRDKKTAFVGNKNQKLSFEENILKNHPTAQVFFGDRVQKSNISLHGASYEKRAIIFNREKFNNIDLKSDFTPTLIMGRIDGEKGGSEINLSIIINGSIRGTTKSYMIDDQHFFQFFVSEESFRQGSNEVAVYKIDFSE